MVVSRRVGIWVVWAVFSCVVLLGVRTTEASARRGLNQRNADRTAVGARFVSSYIDDLFSRERVEAGEHLAAETVSDTEFARAVDGFAFPAAVLLDSYGRALNVWPAKPELIGKDLASSYGHLRVALTGKPAISGVVPSAVAHIPVVAFATPFDTPYGRRVFSGGFDLSTTPLGSFLSNASPLAHHRALLVDSQGGVVASGRPTSEPTLTEHDPALAKAWRDGVEGNFTDDGQTFRYASHAVEGTTWRFVLAVPSKSLYAPLQGGKVAVRALAVALIAFAALVAFLIARLSQRTKEAADARDVAVDATKHKSAFLASMSHEIRTPMNGVMGLTDLLLYTELNDEQREYAELVQTSARSLLTIIDDVLDFSKIEADKLTIENVDFELRPVVNGVANMLRMQAQAKGVDLRVTVADALPVNVNGDPTRFRQILMNLLSNAVKFTEDGWVHLDIRRSILRPELVRIEVIDTGIGMDVDTAESIFRPFTQAETSTTRRFGGTGLGLTITKRLAELMNGDCGVASAPGRGSTFWVEIPLPEAKPCISPTDRRIMHM